MTIGLNLRPVTRVCLDVEYTEAEVAGLGEMETFTFLRKRAVEYLEEDIKKLKERLEKEHYTDNNIIDCGTIKLSDDFFKEQN
jgi:hypothetical protein